MANNNGPLGTSPTMAEMGLERLKPPPGGSLPLNGGLWDLPHYEMFVSFMNIATHTYWWSFDEALRDSQCNSDAMWNDLAIRDPLNARQRPVCLLEWTVKPQNEANKLQIDWADKVSQIIREIPDLQQFKRCLLDAIFFGKYGVNILCKWDWSLGYKRMIVTHWNPIHGDKIMFKWDGTPGILVNPSYSHPQVEYTERGSTYFLNQTEQDAFIYHRFEPEDATYYQPQFAGSVYGTGMRGRIYWYWWLKQNLQKYMMNFVKKVGNGYMMVGFPSGNTAYLNAAKNVMEQQEGNNILYVPIDQQMNGGDIDKMVKHLNIPLSGADFQWTIITGINEMIRQTILGESGTTQANGTGLNSDQEQHGMTADERVKYDATDLETPMQKLTRVLYQWNCPGSPVGRYQSLADKRNPGEIMEAAQFVLDNGGQIPLSWVTDQLGIPDQVGNEPMLAKIQPMQATAVGNTPAGTPVAGSSGPAPPGGGGQPQQPPGNPGQGTPQQ